MHWYDFMTLYQLTLRVMTEGCLLTTKLVMIHFTRYDHHKLSEESQQYNDELYRRDPRHSPCLHAGCTLTRPSRPAWGRLAAIGKSRTVKWRQSSDQTGHSSHISDILSVPGNHYAGQVFKYATWNHQADSRWELQFGDTSSKSGLFYI